MYGGFPCCYRCSKLGLDQLRFDLVCHSIKLVLARSYFRCCQSKTVKNRSIEDFYPITLPTISNQARYPIYRIPMWSTLKDLDACFLTFHSLHTPVTGDQCDHPPVIIYPNGIDGITVVSLPVFGLASYKFKPLPLWVHNDRRLVSDLFHSADNWLTTLQVNHPDYLFFSRR